MGAGRRIPDGSSWIINRLLQRLIEQISILHYLLGSTEALEAQRLSK